jgi:diadenosine tetraphosphate (Ap4A) HIT family hydrolase
MVEEKPCRFCNPYADDVVAKNKLCYARWDRFPVSKGHLLLMPFRHTPEYFSLTRDEKEAMTDLIEECREIIEENFNPAGYNIGYNIGAAAGQTVMHCHCHFIPRYTGDTDNPKGGIRRVVAGRKYSDTLKKASDTRYS